MILATRIVGGVIAAWWIALIIVQVFSCDPIHGYWDPSIPSDCVNAARYYTAIAIPNILTDVVLLALPIRMVWRLQLRLGPKIGLSIAFSTGILYVVGREAM